VQTIKVIQVSYVYPGHNGEIRETKEVGLRKKKKKHKRKAVTKAHLTASQPLSLFLSLSQLAWKNTQG
jgi:hypothetical protein